LLGAALDPSLDQHGAAQLERHRESVVRRDGSLERVEPGREVAAGRCDQSAATCGGRHGPGASEFFGPLLEWRQDRLRPLELAELHERLDLVGDEPQDGRLADPDAGEHLDERPQPAIGFRKVVGGQCHQSEERRGQLNDRHDAQLGSEGESLLPGAARRLQSSGIGVYQAPGEKRRRPIHLLRRLQRGEVAVVGVPGRQVQVAGPRLELAHLEQQKRQRGFVPVVADLAMSSLEALPGAREVTQHLQHVAIEEAGPPLNGHPFGRRFQGERTIERGGYWSAHQELGEGHDRHCHREETRFVGSLEGFHRSPGVGEAPAWVTRPQDREREGDLDRALETSVLAGLIECL
jgi:hypothetical protein